MQLQNQTRHTIIILILLLVTQLSTAQENILFALETNTPIVVSISDEQPSWLTYYAEAGEIITLTTQPFDEENALDTTLEILTPTGDRLAYNDDRLITDAAGAVTIDRNAQIEQLILPVTGEYRIRVDSFNGVSEGDIEVLLTQIDLFAESIEETDTGLQITAVLPAQMVYQTTVAVDADDRITISVRDTSGTLDPVLMLLDEDGQLTAMNDDHASADLALNVLDARLQDIVASADGNLMIQVLDLLGHEGTFEMEIVIEQSG